jgi:hypothetical protein
MQLLEEQGVEHIERLGEIQSVVFECEPSVYLDEKFVMAFKGLRLPGRKILRN